MISHYSDIVYTVPPKPGEQLTKAQAGYSDEGPFTCGNCSWFKPVAPLPPSPYDYGTPKPMGNCAVVGSLVARGGCCDYWNVGSAPQDVGESVTEYVEVNGAHYTCDECIFFDAIRNRCWPVTGAIDPKASCNKWMPNYSAINPSSTMPLDDYAAIRQAVRTGLRPRSDSS